MPAIDQPRRLNNVGCGRCHRRRYLLDLLQAGDDGSGGGGGGSGSSKLLVFAHHLAVLDAVQQVCVKARVGWMRIDGASTHQERCVPSDCWLRWVMTDI
eukprot:COSAG01_NODE_3271_length_6320_cov_8.998554_5_plen_99_part_00